MIARSFRTVPHLHGESYISSVPETLLVLSVFTKELASSRIAGFDIDLVGYTFCAFYFLSNLTRILHRPGAPWKMFVYIILSSVFSILWMGLKFDGFLKQIISVLIIYSVNFVIISDYNITNIFKLYVKFAFYSAAFGIIQVILSYAGIELLIREPGRLDSIAYEPSHYASILVPALVYTFFHFKIYKREFAIMLTALVLTYNLTAYMAFLLVISFAYINPVYIVIAVPALYYLVFVVFPNVNENFNIRILETLSVFQGNTNVLNRSVEANGTTVSLYSNLIVAQNNVKENPLAGAGMGGHDETYYKVYSNSLFQYNYYFGLNSQSAHSLTIRILSEFGILGLILYLVTIIRSVVIKDSIAKSISLACLSHFICKSFKLGGYIDYGTPFFFAMLLINFRQYKLRQ